MIDLNLEDFAKKSRIERDDIERRIGGEAVFKYYIPELVIGKAIESPLRQKDDHPSFGVFHSNKYNKLMFKDQSLDVVGDCVEFVRKLYNYSNLYEACSKIAVDFGIDNDFTTSPNVCRNLIPPNKSVFTKSNYNKQRAVIDIQSRHWQQKDIDYWGQFGITIKTLDKFKVKPLTFMFINGLVYSVDSLAYAYEEIKDRTLYYKIYQPLAKSQKWYTNSPVGVHQGYRQLPPEGDILIITKSLKDVMSLHDILHIPAIGIQNENVMIKGSVMEEYTTRFKNVVCLFDSDPTGRKLSEKYKETYGLEYLLVPNKFNNLGITKDFSDLVKNYSKKIAFNVLTNLLNEKKIY